MLLDEPFSSLDAALREETRLAVAEALRASGATAVLVTHDQAEALSMADQVAVLQHAHGELRALGARPAAAIFARKLRERGALSVPRGQRPATRANPANLTPRELEVLSLTAEGEPAPAVAERLCLSARTVHNYLSAAVRKMGARNLLDAIRVGAHFEVGDAQNLAMGIVEPSSKGPKDFWDKSSYTLLTGCILHLCHQARQGGPPATLPELGRMLSSP